MTIYQYAYETDLLGTLTLYSNGTHLIALTTPTQTFKTPANMQPITLTKETAAHDPAIIATCRWLDDYFAGLCPHTLPPMKVSGTTFRELIWQELLAIPYGKLTTYGNLARIIAKNTGKENMSAQAVGGAVGHNPISIIIPCHRVIGSTGSLTGYNGGIDIKIKLLTLEGHNIEQSTSIKLDV